MPSGFKFSQLKALLDNYRTSWLFIEVDQFFASKPIEVVNVKKKLPDKLITA